MLHLEEDEASWSWYGRRGRGREMLGFDVLADLNTGYGMVTEERRVCLWEHATRAVTKDSVKRERQGKKDSRSTHPSKREGAQ